MNTSIRLLLIEDNRGDANLIQQHLSPQNETSFLLTHIIRLKEALPALNDNEIDVILLDLNLPDSTGGDTFHTLYSRHSNVPIIVLTSLEDEALGTDLISKGAQDYLVKDWIDRPLLIRAIHYAIERHKHVQEEIRQSEREKRFFEHLTDTSTSVTTQSLGLQSLQKSAPDFFKTQAQQFGNLIEQAVEQKVYQIDNNISQNLYAMATQLGGLKAGPKDVIEIHNIALKHKLLNVSPQKAKTYNEEARMIVIELMGHLTAFYRKYATNIPTQG